MSATIKNLTKLNLNLIAKEQTVQLAKQTKHKFVREDNARTNLKLATCHTPGLRIVSLTRGKIRNRL